MSFGSALLVPVLILLFSTGPTQLWASQNVPRVCIEDGCVRGSWMRSVGGEQFEAYVGIPFAKPPIGKLRFASPVPNDPWAAKELDATGRTQKPPCLQLNLIVPGRQIEGAEDCLYLNVYRPVGKNDTDSPKLPTLVYIHGGGYLAGYNTPLVAGAEKLMDHPVILVTVTYRLGALGFLSTGDEAASGNFGLKDQRLALRWVNRNIKSFGGDPRLVTIMGHSAGGASVQLQMMHLANEGLFQRAISLSGSALAPWSAPQPDPERLARHQASVVGIEGAGTMSTDELVEALREVDADLLVSSFAEVSNRSRYLTILYGPTVEKATVEDAFLTAAPQDLWSQASYLSVPWLTGLVPNDGFVFSASILKESACSDDTLWQQKKRLLGLLRGMHNPYAMPLLQERFLNDASVGECLTRETVDILTKMFNEALFEYPLTLSVQQHLVDSEAANQSNGSSRAPIYLYRFNYQGPLSYSSVFTTHDEGNPSPRNFGVVHCDELIYLFRAPILFPDFRRGSADAQVSQRFSKFFVDFARTGIIDTAVQNNELKEEDAPQIDDDFPVALEFFKKDSTQDPLGLRSANIYDKEMLDFWTRFYSS